MTAVDFPENADESTLGAPAKSDSPRRDARKFTRTHEEERDSSDRPSRRLPRAAVNNNTAVAAVLAGGLR
jgi:hypothetical protein